MMAAIIVAIAVIHAAIIVALPLFCLGDGRSVGVAVITGDPVVGASFEFAGASFSFAGAVGFAGTRFGSAGVPVD